MGVARGVRAGVGHSGPGRLRCCLVSERRRFPSSRRRREPLVGRVGRRTGAGTRASRRSAARRSLAALRLRRCERCSAAPTVSTVPESLPARRSRTSARWGALNAVVVARSRESWTRESAVLTPWPPGPEAWENCSTSSPAGTLRPRGAPGPGGTCRSSTRRLSRTRDVAAAIGTDPRPLLSRNKQRLPGPSAGHRPLLGRVLLAPDVLAGDAVDGAVLDALTLRYPT